MDQKTAEWRKPPSPRRSGNFSNNRPRSCLKAPRSRPTTEYTPGLHRSYHDNWRSLDWPNSKIVTPLCCSGVVVCGPSPMKITTVVHEPSRIHHRRIPVYPQEAVETEIDIMRKNAEKNLCQMLQDNLAKFEQKEKFVRIFNLD